MPESKPLNKPFKTPAGSKKKYSVYVKTKEGKIKKVSFGARGMDDWRSGTATQHKDPKRRKNYLARSGGIKNKAGQLTKNDKNSANYWSRKINW